MGSIRVIDRIMRLFRGQDPKPEGKRRFASAKPSIYTDWILTSFDKPNRQIRSDLRQLIAKCRWVSKNNEYIKSFLTNLTKSVLGKTGYRLQCLNQDAFGGLDKGINDEIQWAWYDFGKRVNGYISADGMMSDLSLDQLILRTLYTDGQVFIRIIRDAGNPYGITFQPIDTLCVDYNLNRKRTATQNAIIMGVQIDGYDRPVKYHIRTGDEQMYNTGEILQVDARDMIHIYHKDYIGQTRGIPPFSASLNTLKILDDYAQAQLVACKVNACTSLFYQRNSSSVAGDFLDQSQGSEQGQFVSQMAPGQASVVPQGYSVKSVDTNHPNSNFGDFNKSMLKKVSAGLGVGYSKLASDYGQANYSSLRQMTLEQIKFYQSVQEFLNQVWKQVQFQEWLRSYIINMQSSLKPSDYRSYLNHFRFICRRQSLFDPAKQITAIQKRIALGLTSPIQQIQAQGQDPQEVAESWVKWNALLKDKGLESSFNKNDANSINKDNAEELIDETEIDKDAKADAD